MTHASGSFTYVSLLTQTFYRPTIDTFIKHTKKKSLAANKQSLLTKSNNQCKKLRSWKHVITLLWVPEDDLTTDIAGSLLTLDLA